jgi:hypothetical protein
MDAVNAGIMHFGLLTNIILYYIINYIVDGKATGDIMKKTDGKKQAKRKRGRPRQDGVILSAVAKQSQLNDLDSICLAIRRANPEYKIRRSELMRAIFEAVIPVLLKFDWSDASDHEALVEALEENLGNGR